MADHTLWKVHKFEPASALVHIIEKGSGARIATLCGGWPPEDLQAHANLLAIAPELLDAARAVTVLHMNDDGSVTIGPVGWSMLVAAVAKMREE